MARIRSVKPELRTSLLVASWPFDMRYFWVLLWGYLDDCGRGLDIPKQIAGDCFPHDEKITPSRVDLWLGRMTHGLGAEPGPLCRYEVGGRRYVHAVNWAEHQKPNRPTPSRHPPCPIHGGLTESATENAHESLNGHSVPGEGEKGRRGEGEGGAAEPEPPPPRCPKHLDRPAIGPCGPCGDARRARERWDHEQAHHRAAIAAELDQARADPRLRCHHGTDAGLHRRSDTGESPCALCRTEHATRSPA